MKKWENKCPNCGSKNIKEDEIDIYYNTNPSVFYCQEEDCGTEVTVEMVPYIKSTGQKDLKRNCGFMNALQWLRQFKYLPMSREKPCTVVSNAELKRWIRNGSVLFNAEKVEVNEEIDFPVFSLVFFPKVKKNKINKDGNIIPRMNSKTTFR